MSAETARHLNEKRRVPASPHSRRPATRVLLGVLVAFAYVGILAAAGFFISGAVNSMNENTAVARATIAALRTPPRDETAPAPAASAADDAVPVPAAAELVSPPPAAPQDAELAAPESSLAELKTAALADSPRAPPAAPALTPQPAAPPPPPAAAAPAAPSPPVAALTPPQVAPPPSPAAPLAAPAVAVRPPAPSSEFESLGDERLEQGDVAAARLFYERAADAGNARAARRLGNSFDPAFLTRWGVRFMRGDLEEAARWYRRADKLGDSEAAQDLAALTQH